MSAPNFYTRHASGYYVITDKYSYEFECSEAEHDQDRYYPGSIYAEKKERGPYIIAKYSSLDIYSQKIIRSGYYTDAVLDYDIQICTPYEQMYLSQYDSAEDMAADAARQIIDYMVVYNGLNEGMAAIHRQRIAKKIEAYIKELGGRLDEELKKEAEVTLHCVGIFSNGEAIYCRA